ncbi:hypothetical protein Q7C36_018970 [Tachysurus vachellii]|uniref:Uncharacterized protein n=1 Tax=Tachysurus vachellii TaxID=175792 RepID=A0AA88LVI7_TACVA|nr:hypothetical protein Q7C36_018970 [Tachysurus vachellii]
MIFGATNAELCSRHRENRAVNSFGKRKNDVKKYTRDTRVLGCVHYGRKGNHWSREATDEKSTVIISMTSVF